MPGIDDRATPLFKSVMVYMMLLADQINTFGARQPNAGFDEFDVCLLYTSPSPRD